MKQNILDGCFMLSEKKVEEFFRKSSSKLSSVKFSWEISSGKGEGFSASMRQGQVHIEAMNPQSVIFGLSQMLVAAAGKHVEDYAGASRPRFSLRPLWIGAHESLEIVSGVRLGIPNVPQQQWQEFAMRILELGYNAVIFGQTVLGPLPLTQLPLVEFNSFCKVFRDFGIKIILKPTFEWSTNGLGCCPLNPAYGKWLTSSLSSYYEAVPQQDFLFWESYLQERDFFKDVRADDYTLQELTQAEGALVEKALPAKISLIYSLPPGAWKLAPWVSRFCHELGKKTIFAFGAGSGGYFQDHRSANPFWEQLRQGQEVNTPLLPIVNMGGIFQGEGLWPAPSFDLIDKYFGRLYRHNFMGVVVLVNVLPLAGSLLDLNLWVAGQKLWRMLPTDQLTETWVHAFRPEWAIEGLTALFSEARQVALQLSRLREIISDPASQAISSQECRTMTESLVAIMRDLQLRVGKIERLSKKSQNPSLGEYFQCFSRDAKRGVVRFLQHFNLTSPYAMENEEHQESFWMPSGFKGDKDTPFFSKHHLLEKANRGIPGSSMEAIFKENRLW